MSEDGMVQSMPMSGSFQMIAPSDCGAYRLSHLYWKRAVSLSTTKPWANPLGIKNCLWFSPESSTATCCPYVGDPARMSTATSMTLPDITLTSFDYANGGFWK